jgi:hypothetical protein
MPCRLAVIQTPVVLGSAGFIKGVLALTVRRGRACVCDANDSVVDARWAAERSRTHAPRVWDVDTGHASRQSAVDGGRGSIQPVRNKRPAVAGGP